MVVAAGTPEDIAADPASHTGRFLKPVLMRDRSPGSTRDVGASVELASADAD
jgi:excinuclease ABC subunit A